MKTNEFTTSSKGLNAPIHKPCADFGLEAVRLRYALSIFVGVWFVNGKMLLLIL